MNSSFRHKVPPQVASKASWAGFSPSPPLGDHIARSAQPISGNQLVAGLGSHWAGERWRFCSIHECTAFTLIELLTVIAIIGILLTLGIPMIKGMNKSNSMVAANRQLLDDINYARQRAIADHTSVYIVFIPPAIVNWSLPSDPNVAKVMTNLFGGQYNTYALVALHSVGEQPGRSTPRYLTAWRTLPAGVYIATNKFTQDTGLPGLAPTFFYDVNPVSFRNSQGKLEPGPFPFPVSTNFAAIAGDYHLPHFGFNYLGQLIFRSNNMDITVYSQPGVSPNNMYIPLVRGSIFYQYNSDGSFAPAAPDVAETQPGNAYYTGYNTTNALGGAALPAPYSTNNYNQIYIDPLTGRAKIQHLQIQ